jgi:hypothetical protein
LSTVAESPLADLPYAKFCHPILARAAPIFVECGQFNIHPDPKPPIKSWRVIVAAREAPPSWSEMERAIYGDVIDMAAISLSGDRVIASRTGWLNAIGVDENFPPDIIHVRATPLLWLRSVQGAFLCKPLAQCVPYLRQFDQIVTDTVEQGEAIQAALRRQYQGPKVRIAA